VKIIRRFLAVLLAAMLLFSTAAVAFADNYTITYEAGSADRNESVTKVSKNVDEGDYYTILRPSAVFDDYDEYLEDEYEFDHWEDQNGKEYDPGDTVQYRRFEDGALELTAIWEDDDDDDDDTISYGVTYSAGDAGKNSEKKTYSEDFEAEDPDSVFEDFAEYEEDDYRFVCWMDKVGNTFETGDTIDVSEAPFNTSYNMTLTAVWIHDGDYQVFFRSGTTEAKGTDPDDFYAKYDKTYTLPENPYTFTGFSFAGWDVDGTVMQPGDKYTVRDGLVIKATWTDAGVELTYRPGDGQGTSYTETYQSGETITLAENTFTRTGYTFAGWLIGSVNTVIPEGTSVVIAGNDTATAQWVAESVSAESSAAETSALTEETSEAVSEEESVPEEMEPIAETEKPKTLSYSVSGDTPISGITVELENGADDAELLVSSITEASFTDATTAFLLENGDAAAIFYLSLQSAGSEYVGTTSGTVSFEMNGDTEIPEAPYKSARIAIAHVMTRDAFEGDGYYMIDNGRTVWYDLSDGSTQESDAVSLVETDGICRAVITDASSAPANFAYLSDDATVVELELGSGSEADSLEIGFTSLSPFLLLWVEQSGTTVSPSPLVWVAVGIGITVAVLALGALLYQAVKKRKTVSVGVSASTNRGYEDAVSSPDSGVKSESVSTDTVSTDTVAVDTAAVDTPATDASAEHPDWGEFRQE